MPNRIASISLVVRDYDEALAWYTDKLGFTCLEDTALANGKRWVRVGPGGDFSLLLARAATTEQEMRVGNQAGGRVFLFLETDDFARDHAAFTAAGVRFIEEPRREDYGTVCVFEDLYGNRWDLIGRSEGDTT
jgi:catechol 2,3-dioxygenase-like lactoylglutathione lyase family enzyme